MGAMTWLALVLLVRLPGGEPVARLLRLPRITGYSAVGFLM